MGEAELTALATWLEEQAKSCDADVKDLGTSPGLASTRHRYRNKATKFLAAARVVRAMATIPKSEGGWGDGTN